MVITNEIKVLCEVLKITEAELAKELGVIYETVNHWKNSKNTIESYNLEKLYSFAFSKNIRFNAIYEQLLKEDYQKDNNIVLFYGAKR